MSNIAYGFENYVNYAGSKTEQKVRQFIVKFENYVNYAGSKTNAYECENGAMFENYVNYAGSKTLLITLNTSCRLRTM